MDEPEKAQALDALMRWLEASGGESGEELAATQEEVEEVWLAAWEQRRAETLPLRALRGLYTATHAYLNAGSDPSSPTVQPLQDALAAAFAALTRANGT